MIKNKNYRSLNEDPQLGPQRVSQERQAEVIATYNPDQIPPDFEVAETHAKANVVGRQSKEDLEEEFAEVCPCCLKAVDRQRLKLTSSTQEFSFLGIGIPLYFDFYKYCVLMLVILFSTSGDYNLITNIVLGTSCLKTIDLDPEYKSQKICELNLVTQLSLANKRHDTSLMNLQQILNLVSITIIIGLFQFIRKGQREVDSTCDAKTTSAQDYTVMIKNIPVDYFVINKVDIVDSLKEYFTQYLDENIPLSDEVIEYLDIHTKAQTDYQIPSRVHGVNLSYNLSELKHLNKEKEKWIRQKQEYLESIYKEKQPDDPSLQLVNGVYGDVGLNEIQQKIIEITNNRDFFLQKLQSEPDSAKFFTGIAFLTLNWEDDRDSLILMNQTSAWGRFFGQHSSLLFHGNYLVIEYPPEPNDIIWENLHISTKEKNIRRFIAYCVISIVLAFTSWVIFNISKLQHEAQNESLIVKKLAQLASVIIIFLNFILSYAIKKISELEGYSTYTGYHISVATISGVAQFVNSAIVTWIVFTVLLKNYYHEGGLIYNQTYVFLSNMIIPSVMVLSDPVYWFRLAQRFWEKRKGPKSVKTQQQLNTLYEDPTESLSDRYAAILKTIFLTSFYASIIPVGIILSCMALIISYWASKFNIVKKRTFKNSYGYLLSIEMTENLEIMLPLYCFSNFWFEYIFTDGSVVSSYAIFGIVIGIANAVLPMQEFNQALFPIIEENWKIHPYRKIKGKLESSYNRSNPVTQLKAKQAFSESKRPKNIIKQ